MRIQDLADAVNGALHVKLGSPVARTGECFLELSPQGNQLSAEVRPGILRQWLLRLSEPAATTTSTLLRSRGRWIELPIDDRQVVVLELTAEHIHRTAL